MRQHAGSRDRFREGSKKGRVPRRCLAVCFRGRKGSEKSLLRRGSKKGLSRRHLEGRNTLF